MFVIVVPDMRIELDVSLDPTLGCGQAHRWIKKGDIWEGVLGKEIISLKQTEDGFECSGTDDRTMILDYFRADDDLNKIYADCSKNDPYVASLAERCSGLRLLRQDPWECMATYLLATNANVRRIGCMVENVCREFGKDLGGRYSFPTPEEIIDGESRISNCRLGYRDERFVELAHRVADGDIDPYELRKMDYQGCVNMLLSIKGIGPKVADCIALFSMDHLEAFPIDARIRRMMKERYGQDGNYRDISDYARRRFGRYAGYAQELLYHSGFIDP
ncbi:DNA-3-methyladenine glycosylase family protein [Candidatus Methanarcanum hacksteinii]|uniref:DNA-3-methyladenine glycosylase family protein n=1 Tax=Candidatus Methanarcanum hacksteinii TaxID=2911857 RepID=UPI0037DD3717